MNPLVRVLCCLSLLASFSFAADRAPKVLMDADRAFAKATAERGADGWMEFMAPNAVDLTRETLATPDQIRAELVSEFKLSGVSIVWEPYKAEYLGTGNVGYTIGHYEVRYNDDGKPVVRKGTYLTTWQQQKDGSWKVRSDIGSPDPPSQ